MLLNILSLLYKIIPKPFWKIGSHFYHSYLKTKYLKGKRPFVPGETSKAKSRRLREGFYETYLCGNGLDIGFGGDLVVPNARGWDFEQGDAQYLTGLEDEQFDFVYSSHTLEHLQDPATALQNWYIVLKKG